MSTTDHTKLISILARYMASGKLDPRVVLPAISALAEGEPASGAVLLEALDREDGLTVLHLVRHLKEARYREALRLHKRGRTDVAEADESGLLGDLPLDGPTGWRERLDIRTTILPALRLLADYRFTAERRAEAPETAALVESRFRSAADAALPAFEAWGPQVPLELIRVLAQRTGEDQELGRALERLEVQIEEQHHENLLAVRVGLRDLPQPVPAELDEFLVLKALRERAGRAQTKEEKQRIVDILSTWPTIQAASALREIAEEPWAQERAALILTYRFGGPAATAGRSWDGWHHWLLRCEREVQTERRELDQLAGQRPGELLLIWHSRQEGGDPQLRTLLADWCRHHTRPMDPEGFTVRWNDQIPARELNALLGRDRGIRERAEPVPIAEPVAAAEPPPEPPPAPPEAPPLRRPIQRPPPVPRRAPEPAAPSMWKDHIQPFLIEHWFMVAGILMVIAGSSVTAYYTWDKHWLLRYTLMPAMLAGFTVALATVGTWIEKKGARFRDTAAMLRGAAIGLLPVNFMAVALLAGDEQVAYKVLTVPLLGAVFLVLFGWGLRRWCAAVHAPLGTLLGGTLLVINSLVVLAPVVRSLDLVGDRELLFLLGAGFHFGFLILAVAVVRFTRRVLTRELAEEKRVPWFFGATAAVTFLQVFAWVHGSIGHLPEVTTYAPMIILTGWLVLLVERRTLELKEETGHHDAESFLGFALILLGLLMGIAHPHVRILSFLLAGAAWLVQALSRRHPLHDWISLTLLALAGASVGSLEIFPGSWLPALGIALSLAMGGLGYLSRRREQPELARASTGMRMAVLVVTTVVATLAQWHYDSPPLVTAAYLLVIAGLFGWQARRDQELRWVHTAMVIPALALPYLGFVDMTGRTLRGNTMVFGLAALSLLWLAVNWSTRSPLVRNARSTVLWIYGSLAVAAMVLRVIIERDLPGDVLWYRNFMDYTGPLLMAVVLIFTTYYSRSLIPAGMAAVIVIILFPELRANLRVTFEDLGWGSGLASAASALGLTLLCFLLRRAAFLKDLGEGDLYMGRDPFPLRRYDHRLFVWPLLASIVFLLIKVDTWNLLRNLFGDGVRVRTVVALGLTGVTWTLLAVFQRRHRLAVGGTHLGWIWLSVSIAFGYVYLVDVPRWPHPVLATGVVLQGLYFLYRFGLAPRHAWVDALLSDPTRQVLRFGSQIVSVLCLIALLVGRDPAALWPLMIFVAAQMIWHGLANRSFACGSLLFLLVWVGLVARTAAGGGELLGRLSIDQSLSPTLQLLLGIQILHLLLERKPDHHQALAPLVRPFMFAGSLLAAVLAVVGCLDYFSGPEISFSQQVLLLAVVLLTARAHGSGPLWLSGVFLGYLLVHFDALREVVGPGARFGLLLSPWRWGLLALVMAILGHAGSVLSRRRPALLEGAFSFAFLRSPSVAWMFVPAVGFSCLGAVIQPALRDSAVQLWAPYLGAATLGLVAWSRRRIALWTVAVILVTLGNIHAVRIFWGDFLLEQGLSAVHLLCLGLAAGLVQAFLLRLLPGRSAVAVTLNRASLVLAAGVLALLSINYFAHPNLEAISALRFLISGGMALLAGWYFRRAARDPGPGQESYVEVCEGLYHFGVTMAIWCAALLVPVLRHPTTALWALGLPVLYFYARAELDLRADLETGRRYRNSATILGFVILGLYVFSGIFHLILFPDVPIPMAHYHVNSPFVMLLALLLLRLHGLGGSSWLAFYGGLALIAGSFFGLTALPPLSPFRHPIAAAWCAVGLSHFWTLVSSRRSPVRTAIQDLAAIDGKGWLTLRRSWGIWLLLATQGAVLWGLMNASSSTYMVAPLLVGAASILIHQGFLRRSLLYYLVAVAEVGLALHADFFTPSYLPRGAVIWALLVIWAAVIVIARIASHRMRFERIGTLCGIMALAAFAHVIYHHPGSATGLWAVGLGALLAAWTPRSTRGAETAEERFFSALILGVPAWLVYFSQAPLRGAGPGGAFAVWPLLATVAAVFGTGSFSRFFQVHLASAYDQLTREQPCLFDQTLSWMGSSGGAINTALLWISTLAVATVQLFHYGLPFAARELVLIMGLYAALSVAWYYEGRFRETMAPYVVLQLCVLGLFAVIRRQLMLTTDFWSYEHDVWTSLAVSFVLAGARQILDLQPRQVRIPLLGTLFILPVVALVWVLVHHLGSNVALLVVGLHSLMFAYMGREKKDSPYNLVAIAGFVGFVVITFWSQLELRVLHAYTVPVGVGVLVLLQLFGERVELETRNRVRLVTLLTMLGSAGYYALADDRIEIVHHLTLIILCLLAMGLGSFFRIRLYLSLGFAALVVDLLSILYKVLFSMERSARMTIFGSLVLLIGIGLIFGAAYYKTHQEELSARIEGWRRRFGAWE